MNPSDEEIKKILLLSKNIAIVGASDSIVSESYFVMQFLMNKGYKIFPVNPFHKEILGKKCYPDLSSISCHIDIVNIFRKPEAIPQIVDEAINIKTDVIWMQLGLEDKESAKKAEEKGVTVIMNKCIKIECSKLAL